MPRRPFSPPRFLPLLRVLTPSFPLPLPLPSPTPPPPPSLLPQLENVTVDNERNKVHINFTPTIPHCSMATLIGLCIRVKLLWSLPVRFKVKVQITPGAHASEDAVNKQLNDKERVAAALENINLLGVVKKCLKGSDDVE